MGPDKTTVVPGQLWRDLRVPRLGRWTPQLRVCVVLPARDCQAELDRTMASLSWQSYPSELLDVLVLDDDSTPSLRLPAHHPPGSRILRLEQGLAHGSGRARDAGARATTADVVLFLDADMVADRRHVEAHARWHHVCDHAVVLGRKWFVDFADITAEQVGTATTEDDLTGLLADRKHRRHEWQEEFIDSEAKLTQDSDDAFLAVVGASVSVRRDFYLQTGGFSAFGLRGIVDTEFGYRAFTAGGLLVPDDEALAYHQGVRNFATRGDDIKLQRTGLAANHLPIPLFRPSNTGRQWTVPMIGVLVEVAGATAVQVQVTVDSILSSTVTDLAVTVVNGTAHAPPVWLTDYFAAESRVRFISGPVTSAFPSPVSAVVPAGLALERDALGWALEFIRREAVGVVRTHPGETDGRGVEVWRTRALSRCAWTAVTDLDEGVVQLFGERWVPAATMGVRTARHRVTKQGMIVGD